MQKAPFDQLVSRRTDIFWLKELFTPEEARSAGLLSYSGAEFEFPTFMGLCEGVAGAAMTGAFGYTIAGDTYRERVRWWMENVRGCRIDGDWIVPTHGTIFALATSIRLLTAPGENIMILTPGYNRYEQAATRLGRGTVRIPLAEENGRFSLDFAALEETMAAPENRLLVLCNPNNPTGTVYPQETLARIAELSRKTGTAVFCDEIFADVSFGETPVSVYAAVAGSDAPAITCTSLGKAFSLTGVNHANVLIANGELRERYIAQRNADHFGSIDPMHQAALLAAYTEAGRDWLMALRTYVRENHRILTAFMKKYLPEAVVTEPEGTYVAWVDYGRMGLDKAALRALLVEQGCFCGDPGDEYYGRETCVRYSLSAPRVELLRSLDRLAGALSARQAP